MIKGKTKPADVSIQEKLERSILHGLSMEWEEAVAYADHPEATKMEKPLFSLRDMKSRLGYWSPIRSEITLSRDLVMNHPWYAVLDVLQHEIAHQFAHQVLGAFEETSHGPSFRKACFILRANPEGSGSYPPLDERLWRKNGNHQDKMLCRVKKLMALAQSKNRHEAEAAMAKAHELITKYNLKIIENDEPRQFVSIHLGEPALRHTRDFSELGSLLASFYFVKCLWIPSYVIEKGKMGRVLEITGSAVNVKIAAYVFNVVRSFIDSQWKKYTTEKRLTLHRKTDYAVGVIRGFREKLESKKSRSLKSGALQANSKTLIKQKDIRLDSYFSYRYPRTVKPSKRSVNQNYEIFRDGKKSGKKLVISQAVTERGESGKLLPE